jgi:hypothetical protein
VRRFTKDSTGNKAAEKSGKYISNNEGPRTIPAIILNIIRLIFENPTKKTGTIIITI